MRAQRGVNEHALPVGPDDDVWGLKWFSPGWEGLPFTPSAFKDRAYTRIHDTWPREHIGIGKSPIIRILRSPFTCVSAQDLLQIAWLKSGECRPATGPLCREGRFEYWTGLVGLLVLLSETEMETELLLCALKL